MAETHMPVDIDQVKAGILKGSLRHMKLACALLRQEGEESYLSDEQLGVLWLPLSLTLPSLARLVLYENATEEHRVLLWEIFELHPCMHTAVKAEPGTDGSYWQNTVHAGKVDALALRLQRLWDSAVGRVLAEVPE